MLGGADVPIHLDVPDGQPYLVRIELPTGEIVSCSSGAPSLSLGYYPSEAMRSLGDLDSLPMIESAAGSTKRLTRAFQAQVAESEAHFGLPRRISIEVGCWNVWESLGDQGWRVLLRREEFEGVKVAPSTPFRLTSASWNNPDATAWRPAYCVSLYKHKRHLIVYPPSRSTLTVAEDASAITLPSSSLLASTSPGDPQIDALFSYAVGGSLDAARALAGPASNRARGALREKFSDPVLATVAGYALLKADPTAHEDWVANLANYFTNLPDGAIIHGWHLIRSGDRGAKDYFLTAISRGIPMFTEGVRLLKSGLSYLSGLEPDDAPLARAAHQAFLLSSLANLDSEVTSLLLGRGIDARLGQG